MYCVKCGVKLADGAKSCPLCDTPVLYSDARREAELFPAVYPPKSDGYEERLAGLAFATAILAAVCLTCLIYCLNTYNRVYWSGYVMLGISTLYVIFILPFWFRKYYPLIFVPLDFISVCAYLLYICLYTGGRWFLPFAFPTVMLCCALTTVTIALSKRIKKGKLILTGGLLIAIGGSTMLVEFFESITFQTTMFKWSLYSTSAFGVLGLFLIIAGLIPPLKNFLERKFFL